MRLIGFAQYALAMLGKCQLRNITILSTVVSVLFAACNGFEQTEFEPILKQKKSIKTLLRSEVTSQES